MYIKTLEIKNIRAISNFKMAFEKPAGWHVVIGDNGAGKSSLIRSIAAALVGPEQIASVLPIWKEWLGAAGNSALIELEILPDWNHDFLGRGQPPKGKTIINRFELRESSNGSINLHTNANDKRLNPLNYNWGSNNLAWFSVAYGPFRRFTGGDDRRGKIYFAFPKAGAHLTAFGEDIALTEALDWLKELDRKRLKSQEEGLINKRKKEKTPNNDASKQATQTFKLIKQFINDSGLLPHNAKFDRVSIDGDVIFVDGNKNPVKLTQMSDGYRSIMSMMFELLRQLIDSYGIDYVFGEKVIDGIEQLYVKVPGVVLIDEVDAHLHPAWQTKIGDWFTKHFPQLQFIVTTHSPLICRACENGSIWRLAAPGSNAVSGQIVGEDHERLIFGDILDAYGTEIFGKTPVRSKGNEDKKKRLGELDVVVALGKATKKERTERDSLRKIFMH